MRVPASTFGASTTALVSLNTTPPVVAPCGRARIGAAASRARRRCAARRLLPGDDRPRRRSGSSTLDGRCRSSGTPVRGSAPTVGANRAPSKPCASASESTVTVHFPETSAKPRREVGASSFRAPSSSSIVQPDAGTVVAAAPRRTGPGEAADALAFRFSAAEGVFDPLMVPSPPVSSEIVPFTSSASCGSPASPMRNGPACRLLTAELSEARQYFLVAAGRCAQSEWSGSQRRPLKRSICGAPETLGLAIASAA